MHVILIEPAFPRNQREYARGLHAIGARVTGIGESPLQALDPELRSWLAGYQQVGSVTDRYAVEHAVRRVQEQGWVDRLEATIEAHVMTAAEVREATGIQGTSTKTAWLCRDKPAMKHALREAGIPCAQSTGADSADGVRDFAAEVDYPLILKPLDGAGAAGTHRVDDADQLERAIQSTAVDRGAAIAVEEFVEGHEGFYDTIVHKGEVVCDFVSHYYPNVLEAMRTRWISPQIITTNRIDAEGYGELRELSARVVETLGIETSATHMEWFFGTRGLKFSEIACRPPGVGVVDLYGLANDFDVYAEWARAICDEAPQRQPSRKYSAGMLSFRPDRDGRITGCDGIEDVQSRYGSLILDQHIPPVGTATQGVEAGYMANGWMRVRHSDFDELRSVMDDIGERIHLRAK